MIIDIILVFHRPEFVLFDLGFAFSYIYTCFIVGFDMMFDFMFVSIHVSTVVGESLVVKSSVSIMSRFFRRV